MDTPVIIHVFVEIVRFDIVVLEASLATLIELARWVVQIGQLHNLDLILQVKITYSDKKNTEYMTDDRILIQGSIQNLIPGCDLY